MSDEGALAPVSKSSASIQDRIAAFEMLDRMPSETTRSGRIQRLSPVGSSVADIAGMLQKSPAAVRQAQYEARKKARRKHTPEQKDGREK